jgi:hypothetical protein
MITGDSYAAALEKLYNDWYEPTIDKAAVRTYQSQLIENEEILERLKLERGWSRTAIRRTGLGWTEDGGRITIPYFNEAGYCTCIFLYNVFGTPGLPKMKSIRLNLEVGRVWPINVLEQEEHLVLCEGYADAICALSHDIPAVTIGSCSMKIAARDMRYLAEKTISICYDIDKEGQGQKGARVVADQIMNHTGNRSIRILSLPLKKGHKDLTDYLHEEKHTTGDFIQVMHSTPFHKPSPVCTLHSKKLIENDSGDDPVITLDDSRLERWFNTRWRSEGIVIGKSTFTYFAPKRMSIRCKRPLKKCKSCPFRDSAQIFEVSADDPFIIKLIEQKDDISDRTIKAHLGLKPSCSIDIDVLSAYTVLKVLLSPTVGSGEQADLRESYQIFGYYFGANLQTNITYLFSGYTAKHHKDGSMVAVILSAETVSTTLDTFETTTDVKEKLTQFRVPEGRDPFDHLIEYYEHSYPYTTGIKQRPLIHMAADLVFHSAVQFFFNDELVRKGSLDAIIFGDPRCGKGCIAEGLMRFYEHGEILSGENTSFMNLVGGIKTLSKFRGLCWGRLAIRHRDTVIIDEMSALDTETLGNMSRIRSEGVAEVSKDGINQKTHANCGILWLSNPRDRRLISRYSYGVEALVKLMPGPEDISRFDYAACVAMNEVPTEVINTNGQEKAKVWYSKEACHDLILWIKSRKATQIRFTEEATHEILAQAIHLGRTYTEVIPLIQHENVRFKLAKIATAIAGRIWNADVRNGEVLVVDVKCVLAAVRFLNCLYESPTLGYKFYSELQARFEIVNEQIVYNNFKHRALGAHSDTKELCEQILRHEHLTLFDIELLLGDKYLAQTFARDLVGLNCLLRKHNYFVKTKAFISFLRKVTKGEFKSQPTTSPQ